MIDNLAKFEKRDIVYVYVVFFSSDFQPVSRYNISKETSLVAPGAIRAASICIFSSALILYCVQLSQTTSAYS